MNVPKINSAPAFKGQIVVPVRCSNHKGFKVVDTNSFMDIRKYNNGTMISDNFVSSKDASFQDIASAYNIAKNSNITVDLTTSSMDLKV